MYIRYICIDAHTLSRDTVPSTLWIDFFFIFLFYVYQYFCISSLGCCGTHTVAQGDLELVNPLLPPPECWDYGHAPPHPISAVLDTNSQGFMHAGQTVPSELHYQPLFFFVIFF